MTGESNAGILGSVFLLQFGFVLANLLLCVFISMYSFYNCLKLKETPIFVKHEDTVL
jgi:hypothetical protein